MKKLFLPCLTLLMTLLSQPVFSQSEGADTASLGLPGDNLDLYAVLDVFQKSKTIEEFEKKINTKETGVNNLDLNNDNQVDFIKVVTQQKDKSYTFILRVDVSKTESQDVAVILVDKDKDGKVSMQMVGDETLYGKDYVIEPATKANTPTPNPGYTEGGTNPVVVEVKQAPPTTVVVETTPIVQYVYSPAYVPYVPPYYYGFPPPWFAMGACIAVGIYRHNNWYHHGGYYGGHYHGGNNTVIINNKNNFNNYNNNKMRSNTVNNNVRNNSYNNVGNNNRAGTSNRASNSNRANGPSTSNRASTGNRGSTGPSTNNRASSGASTRPSTSPSTSNRSSSGGFGSSGSSRPSSSPSMSSGGRTRSSGGFSGGGRAGGGGGGGRRR